MKPPGLSYRVGTPGSLDRRVGYLSPQYTSDRRLDIRCEVWGLPPSRLPRLFPFTHGVPSRDFLRRDVYVLCLGTRVSESPVGTTRMSGPDPHRPVRGEGRVRGSHTRDHLSVPAHPGTLRPTTQPCQWGCHQQLTDRHVVRSPRTAHVWVLPGTGDPREGH